MNLKHIYNNISNKKMENNIKYIIQIYEYLPKSIVDSNNLYYDLSVRFSITHISFAYVNNITGIRMYPNLLYYEEILSTITCVLLKMILDKNIKIMNSNLLYDTASKNKIPILYIDNTHKNPIYCYLKSYEYEFDEYQYGMINKHGYKIGYDYMKSKYIKNAIEENDFTAIYYND